MLQTDSKRLLASEPLQTCVDCTDIMPTSAEILLQRYVLKGFTCAVGYSPSSVVPVIT
jgi:hypothetical protein